MSNAVEFINVSKRFHMERDRPRSFQDVVVSAFRPRRRMPDDQDFWALRDVSFEVPKGATMGLIGPNGSGKSTSLKLISRILTATTGEVVVNGAVTALLELGAGFHPELSGRDNIFLNGALMGMSRREVQRKVQGIIDFAEIGDFIDVPVKLYSSGMYVRLGFAAAVSLNPEILLVDEVLAVGDAAFQHKCMRRIGELRRSGISILLVSHDLGAIQTLCQQAIWFDNNIVRVVGKPTDVAMAYLSKVAETESDRQVAEDASAPPPAGDKRQWGSGEVELLGVDFVDAFGAPRKTFLTGAEMNIRVRYRARKRVEDPIFGLAIHSEQGVHICGPNTSFSDFSLEFVEGEGAVVYKIPRLPLLEGSYVVSVAAHNREDTKMYSYHDRVYPFQVFPGATRERYGALTMWGDWLTEPAPEREPR
ncbi:MAG: ABC transporter ATP-binding protein [Thermoflexales bacterium]|nr:ABC transporter ATP-binding protein [Thermoflexales bacterium]